MALALPSMYGSQTGTLPANKGGGKATTTFTAAPPQSRWQTPTSYAQQQAAPQYQGAIPGSWGYSGPLGDPSSNLANWGPKPPPKSLQQQLLEAYQGNAAPLFAQYANNNDKLAQQQADIDAASGARAGAASQGADLENRLLDLQYEQLGLDRATLGRQTPLLDALFGGRAGIRKNEQDYLKTSEQLSEQTLGNQMAGAELEKKINLRNQAADAGVRGSTATQGNRDRIGDIQDAFGIKAEGFKIQRAQDKAAIKQKWDDNYFQGEMDKADTAEKKLAIQDQYKSFDILEKKYGINREQIANSLAQTLAGLNLDRIMSVGQVMAGMQSNDEKTAQLNFELVSKAIADSNLIKAAAGAGAYG